MSITYIPNRKDIPLDQLAPRLAPFGIVESERSASG
jgi:hypothetical protein